jgi:hypothetical protein
MNALDLALQNAAANAPKGEELHLENLDSISDPTQDEFIAFDTELRRQPPSAVSQEETYRLNMEAKYKEPRVYLANDPAHDGLLLSGIKSVEVRCDAIYDSTNFLLNHISTDIKYILETITAAAQSMPKEPDLKHRSLEEWPDTTLLNELVERENDLMPFYYELLKRIGSPELQSLVMSSMQGKNNSLVTLAQLCSALAPKVAQTQYTPFPESQVPFNENPYARFPHLEERNNAKALIEKYQLSLDDERKLTDQQHKEYKIIMDNLYRQADYGMHISPRQPEINAPIPTTVMQSPHPAQSANLYRPYGNTL